ncbi:MAG TPA: hypothetical protein VMW83_13540 [Spirochaetia bacterium]|nr:hypothetical protein [Spirochaetia bacterium]
MEDARLSLHLEPESHYVGLDIFVSVLDNFQRLLHGLRIPSSSHSVEWVITDLRVNSAHATIEPVGDVQAGIAASMLVIKGLEAMEHLEIPAFFSDESVEAVRKLSDIAKKYKMRTYISGLDHQLELTDRTSSVADQFLDGSYWEDYGSVEGSLEMISVHQGCQFNIYEYISGKRIQCHFKRDQFEVIKTSLGCRVLVVGLIRYNHRGEVLMAKADDVSVLAGDVELPSIDKMAGSVPDISGGLTTSEHIRRLRDEY